MDLHLKARVDTIGERCSVRKHEFGYAGIRCKKKKRFPIGTGLGRDTKIALFSVEPHGPFTRFPRPGFQ